MARLGIHDIRAVAKQVIGGHPGGIRFTALVNTICEMHPETPKSTIHTQVSTLHKDCPSEVVKPSRGLFQLASASSTTPVVPAVVTPGVGTTLEQDFYESFAAWLKDDLDEVSHVQALGGAGLRGKWGTPDIVGVYKPTARDIIKFPLELVSAEMKTDPSQPVVAFGQAAAYRLFSHRVYIAMPDTLAEGDESRLESLCMLFEASCRPRVRHTADEFDAPAIAGQAVTPQRSVRGRPEERTVVVEPQGGRSTRMLWQLDRVVALSTGLSAFSSSMRKSPNLPRSRAELFTTADTPRGTLPVARSIGCRRSATSSL